MKAQMRKSGELDYLRTSSGFDSLTRTTTRVSAFSCQFSDLFRPILQRTSLAPSLVSDDTGDVN